MFTMEELQEKLGVTLVDKEVHVEATVSDWSVPRWGRGVEL